MHLLILTLIALQSKCAYATTYLSAHQTDHLFTTACVTAGIFSITIVSTVCINRYIIGGTLNQLTTKICDKIDTWVIRIQNMLDYNRQQLKNDAATTINDVDARLNSTVETTMAKLDELAGSKIQQLDNILANNIRNATEGLNPLNLTSDAISSLITAKQKSLHLIKLFIRKCYPASNSNAPFQPEDIHQNASQLERLVLTQAPDNQLTEHIVQMTAEDMEAMDTWERISPPGSGSQEIIPHANSAVEHFNLSINDLIINFFWVSAL